MAKVIDSTVRAVSVMTAELKGRALDWAVATSIGEEYRDDAYRQKYSSDWSQCGELMEKHSISCYQATDPETRTVLHWVAVAEKTAGRRKGLVSADPKIAICRAIVDSHFGSTVEIPTELLVSIH